MEVKPSRKSYRAKFAYTPTDPKHVALCPGDKITDVVDVGSGWVICNNKNTGKTGVCPSDYLQTDMATRIRSLSLSKFRNRVSTITFNMNNSGIAFKNPGKQLLENETTQGLKPATVQLSPGQRVLQVLVGLFGGAVLGGILLVALYYLYGFTFKVAAGVSGAITLIMSLGLIFFQPIRCVAVLMGVSMFTNQGRVALLSLVPGLILTGPIMNMHRNINEGVNSVACVGQVLYNHSNALQQNALEFLVRQQQILEEGERKINEEISNLTTKSFPGASTNTTKTDGGSTGKLSYTLRISSAPPSFRSTQTDSQNVWSPSSLQEFSTSSSSRSVSPLQQESTTIARTAAVTKQRTSFGPTGYVPPQATTQLSQVLPSRISTPQLPIMPSTETTTEHIGATIIERRSTPTSKSSGTFTTSIYRVQTKASIVSSIEITRQTTTASTTQSESTTRLASTTQYVLPQRKPRDVAHRDEIGDTSSYLECVERLQRMRSECQERVNQSKQTCEDASVPTEGRFGRFSCKSTCKVLSYDVLCSHLNETVCTSPRRTARSVPQSPQQLLGERLKKELGFRVNVSRVLDVSTNNSFNPAEQILEVKKKIQDNMDKVIDIFSLINKILILFIIWALISACLYLRKYLKKASYDNIYITSGFKDLNSKLRKIEQRKALLPLEKKEKKKYVDSTSAKPGRAEAFAWTIGMTRVIFHIIIATFFILMDFALFYVLELISQNGGSDFLVSGGAVLDVDVEGVGPLAEFVRNIYAGNTASNKFQNVLNFEQCLPSATAPSWNRVYTIMALYVATLLFVFFQSFGLRLRRKISAFFFPQRENERVHYLYRHILLERRVREEEKKRVDLLNDEWGPFLVGPGNLQTTEL